MSNILVAYFSATGNTKKVAKQVAEATGADLYEIVPEEPYTDKDLSWMNPFSRTTREMRKKNLRPAILGKVADMEKYKKILLGFPIWWYKAPRIIDTFLEEYDFSGKSIGLFATSGGSDFGNIVQELSENAQEGIRWAEPMLLNDDIDKNLILNWAARV